MAEAPVQETPEQLKCQTWVLKVSIHCEGCKKKVKKVMQSVYATDVDPQQHKVTVTGSVDAETLIKKLVKMGKHAELFPEKPDRKEKNAGKSKDNGKKNEPKYEETGGSNGQKKHENSEDPATKGESGESKDLANKNGGENGDKKKKKKKRHHSDSNDAGEGSGSGTPTPAPDSNLCRSPQHMYLHPPFMYLHPPMYPVPAAYTVSCSMANPSTSSCQEQPVYAHAFSYPATYPPVPPSHCIDWFDDEDDDGFCSIM
ncbi:heavy metal-associated isoprenylated plant protein 36-like isoform X2 [Malania oleifera]|uniref:heavy metal-associated isoprenylated plant protein 36-like isoform X2 n=1 Tax=Malania oleifera TaxID=397392 RepID=UPI0025AE1470|nr:heavy metal-associated isoprenylated plant protein 36-like isoform X2 [Malania oleifera]